MGIRSIALAAGAGVAAFLLVAVTELARPRIEFSLFVGIPAGIAAGAFTVAVYPGLADDAPASRRRAAGAAAAFGVGFVVVFVALGWVAGVGAVTAIVGAVVAGLAVGVAAYLRGPG